MVFQVGGPSDPSEGYTHMLIYFIFLCSLPMFGFVTDATVLARTNPLRLAHSKS